MSEEFNRFYYHQTFPDDDQLRNTSGGAATFPHSDYNSFKDGEKPVVEAAYGGETPATPNSLGSSSASEAAEDNGYLNKGKKKKKMAEDGEGSSKKESYYRCTTEKCLVKKRLERSFIDPSIVITTYEGQHNHNQPAPRRGDMAGMFAPPSMLVPPLPQLQENQSFPPELLVQIPHQHLYNYNGGSTGNLYHQPQTLIQHQQQFHQFTDHGLL
ncbi:hypothetical protein BUALT_Bualt18G0122200 [Buddleja alternifolia]|uniref:WRKY domain-containing protein n=1 Tax=Buddleja alternifolia TaxID=168488 RepID=A0AAV6WCE4_9LAMI|nr:hypothetical protein BUALT_Bualt18G0122200 [Buddleja alternifolia]